MLLPLLLAAFSITQPSPLPLPATVLQPAFDTAEAARLARELDALYPDRSPGSPSSPAAAGWVHERLSALIPETTVERFTSTIPGRGATELRNVVAIVPGRSLDTILVLAHRDTVAGRAGLVDNASGTGALVELARGYSTARGATGGVSPSHTLVFASTDAGAYGMLGARELARSPRAGRTVAAISLDAIAAGGAPRVAIAGRGPASPPARLLATVLARLRDQGAEPATASAAAQLVDLALPLGLTEQLELLGEGIPAVAVSSDDPRETAAVGERLDTASLGLVGRAAETAVASLDASLEPAETTSLFVYSGGRIVQGWALALLYVAALVPFGLAFLDLVIRLRRRGVSLRPAFRSYARRLAFWLWAGGVFLLFGLVGAWAEGEASAVNPATEAAGHWPQLSLAVFALVVAAGWLVSRRRLRPRRQSSPEEETAAIAAALTALGVICLVTIATNIYGLLFLLPSAHAWLFIVQVRDRPAWLRGAVYAAGLAGPLLLLVSLAYRFGLGLDAPWYLAELVAIGYVPIMSFVAFLAWGAVAAQALVATSGRYGPYPDRDSRPRSVAATVLGPLAGRGHRQERTQTTTAAEGK